MRAHPRTTLSRALSLPLARSPPLRTRRLAAAIAAAAAGGESQGEDRNRIRF